MQVLHVHVQAKAVELIKYPAKGERPAGELRKQKVWVQLTDKTGAPEPYPTAIEILLPRDEAHPAHAGYAPGMYTLHPASFTVKDGRFYVDPVLQPLPQAAAKQ